jgi:predicted small secreted protein
MARRERLAFAALAAVVLSAGLVMGGCNTVAGIGYDFESIGKGISGSAEGSRTGINDMAGVEERPAYTPTQNEMASRKY